MTACPHLSWTGEDKTPIDAPDKVWVCDMCGKRLLLMPDPEGDLVGADGRRYREVDLDELDWPRGDT